MYSLVSILRYTPLGSFRSPWFWHFMCLQCPLGPCKFCTDLVDASVFVVGVGEKKTHLEPIEEPKHAYFLHVFSWKCKIFNGIMLLIGLLKNAKVTKTEKIIIESCYRSLVKERKSTKPKMISNLRHSRSADCCYLAVLAVLPPHVPTTAIRLT